MGDASLDDAELIERASEAANGAKLARLWRGDTAGYPSHSEADMALCCLLAFSTGGDPHQMDRLFRDSGLMREKWNAVHYADGRTYGEATIQRALRVTSERYEPATGNEAEHGDRTTEGTAAEMGAASERGSGDCGGAAAGDSSAPGEDDLTASVPPEPGDRTSVAHLREENAVLRDRLREQQARIEALEAQVTRETTADTESDRADESQERPSGAVFQRLRTVLQRRNGGSSDDS